MTHEYGLLREPNPRALALLHRPPPVMLGEQVNVQFHVERIFEKRRRHGHNQYLVQWHGYPEAYNVGE